MTIKIEGIEKITRRFDKLIAFQQWASAPMEQTTALIQDKIAKYPRKSPGAFSRLATPGQRRAYWAKVRSGEINHREGMGYVRSGAGGLGGKWVGKVTPTTNGVRGEVGNNAKYVRFVQDDQRQQPFHKASGWVTDKQVIDKTERARATIWRAAIRRVIDRP
jgi:hypothetical protein